MISIPECDSSIIVVSDLTETRDLTLCNIPFFASPHRPCSTIPSSMALIHPSNSSAEISRMFRHLVFCRRRLLARSWPLAAQERSWFTSMPSNFRVALPSRNSSLSPSMMMQFSCTVLSNQRLSQLEHTSPTRCHTAQSDNRHLN